MISLFGKSLFGYNGTKRLTPHGVDRAKKKTPSKNSFKIAHCIYLHRIYTEFSSIESYFFGILFISHFNDLGGKEV